MASVLFSVDLLLPLKFRTYPAVSTAGVAMPDRACAEFGGTSGRWRGDIGKIGEATEGGDSLMIGSGTIGMLEVDVLRMWPGRLIAGICSCAVRPCVILAVMLKFSIFGQINGHDVKLLVSVPRSEVMFREGI